MFELTNISKRIFYSNKNFQILFGALHVVNCTLCRGHGTTPSKFGTHHRGSCYSTVMFGTHRRGLWYTTGKATVMSWKL